MKREDVKRMLRHAEMAEMRGRLFSQLEPHQLAALCRRWLAVEDAPTGRVDMLCAADAIVVDEIERPEPLNKQRVRIVPEQGEGEGQA